MRFEITNEHLIDGVLPEDFIWPDAVTKISAASDCVIRGLTNIPAGVTKLDLLVCRNLRSLDLSGANGLQEVDLRNSAIENLTNIPDCVTKLDLRNSAIENLTNIPDCVTKLDLANCGNLRSLDLSGANGL